MKCSSEVIPIETGADYAAARINQQSQPKIATLDSEWASLQRALRDISEEAGAPIRTKRWEYQWPTFERFIKVSDDEGNVVTTPAFVSMRGLLKHTPKSRAFGALDQLYRCQIAKVPILPPAQRELWNSIESRTTGYEATIIPIKPGTTVIENHVMHLISPLRSWIVEELGPRTAAEKYTMSLDDQSARIANFMTYLDLGSGSGPDGGEGIHLQARAM